MPLPGFPLEAGSALVDDLPVEAIFHHVAKEPFSVEG